MPPSSLSSINISLPLGLDFERPRRPPLGGDGLLSESAAVLSKTSDCLSVAVDSLDDERRDCRVEARDLDLWCLCDLPERWYSATEIERTPSSLDVARSMIVPARSYSATSSSVGFSIILVVVVSIISSSGSSLRRGSGEGSRAASMRSVLA